MGCFSWMYCDKNNAVPLNIGGAGYLLNPFGENYFESDYDGYGCFDGFDAYALVAEWNRDFVPIMLEYADKNKWGCTLSEMDKYNLKAFYNREPISYEKRLVGILMACYDEDNARLFYPIKISTTDVDYNVYTNTSLSDPNQGFGYIEDDDWY